MVEVPLPRADTPPGPYSYAAEKRVQHKRKHNGPARPGHHKRRDATDPDTRPQADPVFGQTSALPGFDDQDDTPESSECLRYMRAVRAEAMDMATVMTAPRNDTISLETDDGWEDGAYVAWSDPDADNDSDSWNENSRYRVPDVQHDALCNRFVRHRAQMARNVSSATKSALDTAIHPISIPRASKRNPGLRLWRYHLQSTTPDPVQLVRMANATVLGVLDYAEGILRGFNGRRNISPILSRWIWALLGRLDEVDQLATDEVGIVRGLAKTAVALYARYRARLARTGDEGDQEDPEMAASQLDPYVHDDEETNDDETNNDENTATKMEDGGTEMPIDVRVGLHNMPEVQSDTSNTRPVEQISLQDVAGKEPAMVPDVNTLATLEMIISIVGAYYGQKDLLESRDAFWEYQS